jgi:hypothetical protein
MKIKSLIVFPLLTLTFGLAPDFFASLALAQNNRFGTQATPPGVTQGKTDPCSNNQENAYNGLACCAAENPDLSTALYGHGSVSPDAAFITCLNRRSLRNQERAGERLKNIPPIPGDQ